jgi:hypothetical protein
LKNISLCLLFGLLCVSCQTGDPQVQGDTAAHVRNFIQNIEPGLKPAAAAASSLVLSFAVSDKDRADVKADLYVIASIVAAATPDQTPGDLSKAIQAAVPKNADYRTLADAVAGGWAIALPFIKGDPALLIKVTGDIAAGVVLTAGS